MRKLVVVVCAAFALAMVPGRASAGPIRPNQCTLTDVVTCDLSADYETNGSSSVAGPAGLGGYLPGYTFLLSQTANLIDGFGKEDVAHILVIHDNLFELFSNTVFNFAFGDIFDAAGAGALIDGVSPSIGQVAGCPPVTTGVPNLGNVGYCTTADTINLVVNWGVGGEGGLDFLNLFTAIPVDENPTGGPTDPNPVPEPGTISLFALGGSAALASIRRRRRAAALQG